MRDEPLSILIFVQLVVKQLQTTLGWYLTQQTLRLLPVILGEQLLLVYKFTGIAIWFKSHACPMLGPYARKDKGQSTN